MTPEGAESPAGAESPEGEEFLCPRCAAVRCELAVAADETVTKCPFFKAALSRREANIKKNITNESEREVEIYDRPEEL